MLYIALVLSAVLLLAVNAAACQSRRAALVVAGCGLGLALSSPFFCLALFPPVVLQSLLLCLVGGRTRYPECHRPGHFFALSLGASLTAYGIVGVSVAGTQRDYAQLRERFPYRSMEERVPMLPESPARAFGAYPSLEYLESTVEREIGFLSRSQQLQRLHDQSVRLFVNSPGFGMARMLGDPSERGLSYGLHDEPAPAQPDSEDPSSLAFPEPCPSFPNAASMTDLLTDSFVNFVHPKGFGFFKDRRRVAGFQSHGFGRVPVSSAKWEVGRLELVSLLLHRKPMVYVSPKLPRMDDLEGVSTRPLDSFEAEGLSSLRHGQELFVQDARMVGAIRSTKQCLVCHGGGRGDLLGAFSYRLRPAKL